MAKSKKLTAAEKEQPPLPHAAQMDKIDGIHKAALAYKHAQQEFSSAGNELEKWKSKVIDLMHENELAYYQHGNVTVDLKSGKEKVKVEVVNAAKD